MYQKNVLVAVIFLLSASLFVNSQIHRAKSPNSYHLKYDNNYTAKSNQLKQQQQQLQQEDDFIEDPITHKYLTWVFSLVGILFVGLSGVLPVAILPRLANNHADLVNKVLFKCLLAFAAGSLIGDVFIHLLPETYTAAVLMDHSHTIPIGVWSIVGLLSFMVIEKVFPDDDDEEEEEKNKVEKKNKKNKNKKSASNNGKPQELQKHHHQTSFFSSIKTMALLNLVANVVDNFTHGIAVAGSFQASHKFGAMTLIATLVHEVPHEIGDFVILLKSGLSYWQAARAQLMTAFAGLIGAVFALSYSSAKEAGDVTSWILPFTSGGFLYISLVGIVPDLVKEKSLSVSIKQLISFTVGVLFIFLLASVFE